MYSVPFAGGAASALPMPTAGAGEYSPDGKRLLYSPAYNEFRPWKRYEGGWARDLWIYDLESKTSQQVTNHPRSDGDPMWTRQGLYFVSDRSGHANVYGLDESTHQVRALTSYAHGDVRWASADPASGKIVFELEGALHVLDPVTGEERGLQIRVPADYPAARPADIAVDDKIEQMQLSPNGRRIAVIARGELFTLPVGEGVTRNLTHSSGAHEREAVWSADSTRLAFISDASGEEDLWLAGDEAASTPRQLTSGHRTRWYRPRWSPDGLHIAMANTSGVIYTVDTRTGATTRVDATGAWFALDFEWSPDSRYLAYGKLQTTFIGVINVWDTQTGQIHAITDPTFNSFSPAWDPGGELLFVLSDRQPSPLIDGLEWNYTVDRSTGIYAIALRPGVANPFPPSRKRQCSKHAASLQPRSTSVASKHGSLAYRSRRITTVLW